eukprot:COSAG05_NODE_10396_length_567_cov_2.576923_2_plen_150_part_01
MVASQPFGWLQMCCVTLGLHVHNTMPALFENRGIRELRLVWHVRRATIFASSQSVFEIPSRISVFLLNVSCCSEPLSRSTLPSAPLHHIRRQACLPSAVLCRAEPRSSVIRRGSPFVLRNTRPGLAASCKRCHGAVSKARRCRYTAFARC